ncbi:hypothetical protein Fmac_025082 [Flemingia macrophylla]|uniref:Uncharacterized protein n=1 Tax=Flemingia macrophylla TaxID=520843 RepID=A0ABD1LR89_9FABA
MVDVDKSPESCPVKVVEYFNTSPVGGNKLHVVSDECFESVDNGNGKKKGGGNGCDFRRDWWWRRRQESGGGGESKRVKDYVMGGVQVSMLGAAERRCLSKTSRGSLLNASTCEELVLGVDEAGALGVWVGAQGDAVVRADGSPEGDVLAEVASEGEGFPQRV